MKFSTLFLTMLVLAGCSTPIIPGYSDGPSTANNRPSKTTCERTTFTDELRCENRDERTRTVCRGNTFDGKTVCETRNY